MNHKAGASMPPLTLSHSTMTRPLNAGLVRRSVRTTMRSGVVRLSSARHEYDEALPDDEELPRRRNQRLAGS